MDKVKILLTCPNCGNGTWLRVEDGFECLSCGDIYETEEMCSEAVSEKIEPSNPWHDVKADPPVTRETVLALCKDGGQFVGYYTGGEYGRWHIWTARCSSKIVTRTVTHWMPLPKNN